MFNWVDETANPYSFTVKAIESSTFVGSLLIGLHPIATFLHIDRDITNNIYKYIFYPFIYPYMHINKFKNCKLLLEHVKIL